MEIAIPFSLSFVFTFSLAELIAQPYATKIHPSSTPSVSPCSAEGGRWSSPGQSHKEGLGKED